MTADLHSLPLFARDRILRDGWVQGTMRTADGRLCLTGALRECSPQPGDWYLAREVYRARGQGEGWNDQEGRTVGEVLAALSRPIADDDLLATFGPQWAAIVALVRRSATLTPAEADALAVASAATEDAAGDAAWDAAWDAATRVLPAGDAAWDAARDAARDAAWDAARDAARDAAGDAAWAAACALVVRDVLDPEHYAKLTRPWATFIGPVHPDDPPAGTR